MSDSAAWKQIAGPPGASFVNGRIEYDKVTRNWLTANHVIPQRWVTGVLPLDELSTVAKSLSQEMLDLYFGKTTCNERSKPVGLTKDHVYKDSDGDSLTARNAGNDGTVLITEVSADGAYVSKADSIPLALNVLGYDRMGKLGGFETTVGGYVSHGVLVNSQEKRDQALAIAVGNLKSIDRYDQRADERRAAAEAKKAYDAKRVADLEAATKKLRSLSETVADFGATAIRAEELAEAAAKYKAAFDAHAGV